MKLGKQLDSVSQVAINVYNDFLYLSQEILGLAFEVCVMHSVLCIFLELLVIASSYSVE